MADLDNRTFKSLEQPANYFGCHVQIALIVIMMPVVALLGFTFLHWLTALLVLLSALVFSGILFGVGAALGRNDGFWPEAGHSHFFDGDDYLDV